ncbi:hypothetical protein MW887_008164 [Aspergillus wentii]|nr:hypothetical protein MW887_008164 [Aspergillus wentii]
MDSRESQPPLLSDSDDSLDIKQPQKQDEWRPFYLRRRLLAGYTVIFCVILASLETVNQVSRSRHGIVSSNESRHYLWTYGPTAILSLIAAIWARTEHQSKQSIPWQAMLDKPTDASKSVLLDYVSMAQIFALPKALRNGNYIVASTVTASLLFRLLVIFSTGLLSLQQVHVERDNIPIQLLESFNANTSRFANLGTQPYNILNGVMFYNLTYPEGSTSDLVFQQFSAPSLPSDARISTTVDAMAADLDCEPAIVHIDKWELTMDWYGKFSKNPNWTEIIRLTTPSCTVSNVSLDVDTAGTYSSDEWRIHQYYNTFQSAQCDGIEGDDGGRVLVTMAEVKDGPLGPRYNVSQPEGQPAVSYSQKQNRTLARSAQLICKPTYSLFKLQVEMNATESLSKAHLKTVPDTNTTLPGLTAWNIADASFQYGANEKEAENEIGMEQPFGVHSLVYIPMRIGLFLSGTSTLDIDNMFHDNVLQNVAKTYYRAMSTQLVRQALVDNSASESNGTGVLNENRLLVENLSLRGMEACVAVMIVLVMVMILLTSRNAISPQNAGSLSSMASILARSQEFTYSLRGTGAAPLNVVQDSLMGGLYSSHSGPDGFAVRVNEDPRGKIAPIREYAAHIWRPFPRMSARVVIFILLVLVIAALESVLQVSQKNNGLGDVDTGGYIHFVWTLVPAVIMVSIAMTLSCIDFNTRCLAPYAQLRQKTGTLFHRSMTVDLLDTISILNVFKSIRLREWAVLATTVMTLIGSFLTIVASGLYSAIQVPQITPVTFQQDTLFTGNLSALGDRRNGGTQMAGLVLWDNLTYPQWTYEELAFPELTMDANVDNSSLSSVGMIVPAARANLTCRLYASSEMQSNFSRNQHYDDSFFTGTPGDWNVNINLTQEYCPSALGDFNEATVITVHNIEPNTYFGMTLTSYTSGMYKAPDLCSNITYVWGHVGESSVDQIALLTCNETAEMVDTTVRFQLPDLDIDQENPPVPDESTVQPYDIYRGVNTFDWKKLPNISTSESLDTFFQAAVYGKYAIPIETFGSEADNNRVADAVKHTHRIIEAQYYANYTRISAENSSLPLLTGNATRPDHWRLVQDAASTRVLEALLAAMVILGVLATVLMNTDHVLPKNPCSIAAVASLFADSNILEQYEDVPRNEKQQEGMFAKSRFYLGWEDDADESTTGHKDSDRFTIYARDSEGRAA